MVKEYPIDLSRLSRSNLSHHLRTAQSMEMEVEGTTTPVHRRLVRLEDAQGQNQEQEQLFVAKLSNAPSPQVQTEPLDCHPHIDGEIINTHT